ncbi:hypothetical protein MO767_26320 [Pseudomonas sp. UYIF39]|uniref:hypothetical protein n=1 Tax=Pseudomonas sp. UYIF39 TaxID=1630747 RepID=UPI00249EC039|nr:hypothetical protein [Pseudomonas sp. UYIF39]MDI3357834.1 hypothetical protein [Pseudomonas sp. UYIF39]
MTDFFNRIGQKRSFKQESCGMPKKSFSKFFTSHRRLLLKIDPLQNLNYLSIQRLKVIPLAIILVTHFNRFSVEAVGFKSRQPSTDVNGRSVNALKQVNGPV